MKDKYFGRERVCVSFIDKDIKGKTLNLGAGEILWLENDIFRGNSKFYSTDIESKNLEKQNLAKNKKIMGAEKIEFPDDIFSQVIILDVLEHIKNDSKVLEEIYRVLKREGLLIISVPNDTILSFLNPIRYAQHERHYTIKKITRLLKNKGFMIEEIFSGGKVWELMNLYSHLLIKYATGRKISPSVFEKLRDEEYSKHN